MTWGYEEAGGVGCRGGQYSTFLHGSLFPQITDKVKAGLCQDHGHGQGRRRALRNNAA